MLRLRKILKASFFLGGLWVLCLLCACSGSSSGSASSAAVGGLVIDGPIAGATVQAYVMQNDGTTGAPVGSPATTDASGAYTLRLPVGTGPLIIRSTGGIMKDWATGTTYNLASHHTLSAALPAITGSTTVHITPVTHIAAYLASGKASTGIKPSESVSQANKSIATYFGLSDIHTTQPIDPTKNDGASGATQASIDYGMILAGFSQHASSKNLHPMSLASALALDGSDGTFDGKQGNVQLQCTNPSETSTSNLSSKATGSDLSKAAMQFQASASNKSEAKMSPALAGKTASHSGKTDNDNTVAAPYFLPYNQFGAGGSAIISLNTPVAIATDTSGATILYTTDGTTPSQTNGTVYTAPIVVDASATLRAIAQYQGMQDSSVSSVTYTIYQSPYDISPIFTFQDLTADDASRNAISLYPSDSSPNPSSIALDDWYNSSATYYQNYPGRVTWGPPAAQYPAQSVEASPNIAWQQQRIIAIAQQYINTQYQHHSLMQWDPPQTWHMDPSNPVLLGHQSKGIDCSNFSRWNYTFGLGIFFTANVGDQANLTDVSGSYGTSMPVQTVVTQTDPPMDFLTLVSNFQMGDLLYINNPATHVITWIGQVNGQGDYLVIDSHDIHNVTDVSGNWIPTGVQIRPFKQFNDDNTVNWYFQNFWKANRIIGANN